MSSEIKHRIKGTEIRPVNADEIGIKINFSQDTQGDTVNELNIDSVILAGKGKDIVIDHIINVGIFQGIPYEVEVDGIIIEMFVDLTSNPRISGEGDSDIEVKVKKRKSFAQFKENADNLSFEAVNKTHPITVIDIPYVVIPDNQGAAFISAAIGTMVLGKALYESVLELVKSIQEFTEAVNPTDTVLGTSAGAGAGVVTAFVTFKPGSVLMAALKLAARILYFIALMLLFVNMLNAMLKIISPLVHNLKGSKILELMNKGCTKLGYTFESTILSNDFTNALTIVPVPLVDGNKSIWQQTFFSSFNNSYNKGYPTASDTVPTLGALIDAMLDMFNAKIIVDNGNVKLERRDFLYNISADKVKNTLNLQGKRENEWTFNTGDSWKRYWIHYQVDQSDIHTVDNMVGVHAEYSTEPTSVVDLDLVNIKGLSNVSIPFAFATRKNEVTALEKAFKHLSVAVNAAGSVFGSSESSDSMKSSLGVMKISQQHFTTTKIMYSTGGGKQSASYLDKLSSTKLWIGYHSINKVSSNLKRIYSAQIPFSNQNLVALQGNNYFYDTEDQLLEILSFEWINQTKTANIEFAVEAIEESNTTTIKIR